MGVYIKGIEMPQSCESCPCKTADAFGGLGCQATGYIPLRKANQDRPDWCPLVPVPPHGRLIDKDEISKHKYATIPPYRKEYSDGKPKSEDEVIAFKFGWNDAIDAIVANAPTIIEAEEGEA